MQTEKEEIIQIKIKQNKKGRNGTITKLKKKREKSKKKEGRYAKNNGKRRNQRHKNNVR